MENFTVYVRSLLWAQLVSRRSQRTRVADSLVYRYADVIIILPSIFRRGFLLFAVLILCVFIS